MTAPAFDSLSATIRVEEARMPELRSAFERAVASGDSDLIYSTGGALLASLYGLSYNRLNKARRDPAVMLGMIRMIQEATKILLGEARLDSPSQGQAAG